MFFAGFSTSLTGEGPDCGPNGGYSALFFLVFDEDVSGLSRGLFFLSDNSLSLAGSSTSLTGVGPDFGPSGVVV